LRKASSGEPTPDGAFDLWRVGKKSLTGRRLRFGYLAFVRENAPMA
jgi:hypothetical protein